MSLRPSGPGVRPGAARSLAWRLVVEVGRQILGRHGAGDTVEGHVETGRPDEGVEHHPPEVVVGPVAVEVGAGAAEAAAPLGTLVRPSEDLAAPLSGPDGGVVAVGAIGTLAGVVRRDGREDR
ncbi:MAG: hypothetical protein ACK55I_42945, partial [bacterium]